MTRTYDSSGDRTTPLANHSPVISAWVLPLWGWYASSMPAGAPLASVTKTESMASQVSSDVLQQHGAYSMVYLLSARSGEVPCCQGQKQHL